MNEFFFWFIRPIAETLGAFALLALFFGGWLLWAAIEDWRAKRKSK